jgi:hypothetical protein
MEKVMSSASMSLDGFIDSPMSWGPFGSRNTVPEFR